MIRLFLAILVAFLIPLPVLALDPARLPIGYKLVNHNCPTERISPRGIRNDGTIYGVYEDKDSRRHGFILYKGKCKTFDYPGAIETYILGTNQRGDVVGRYIKKIGIDPVDGSLLTESENFLYRSRRFQKVGVPLSLIPDPQAFQVYDTNIVGITADGKIFGNVDVGVYFRGLDGEPGDRYFGFVMDVSGRYSILECPGQRHTIPDAVSERKDVIVWNIEPGAGDIGYTDNVYFLYANKRFGQITLDPAGGSFGPFTGVNRYGHMVGNVGNGAFILRDGVYSELPSPGPDTGIGAQGVNDHSTVVVGVADMGGASRYILTYNPREFDRK